MNLNLNKTHFFCASATGLWLLASKAYAYSQSAGEGALENDEQSLFGAANTRAGLEDYDRVPRALSPLTDGNFRFDPDGGLTPPSTSEQGGGGFGTIVLTASNALKQLRAVMPLYHGQATYEDNVLSLAGARSIFYHFLTVICLFLKVEITVKDIKSEPQEKSRMLYTAECTRRVALRRVSLMRYFLPEAVEFAVRTTCLVDGGYIVRHQDHYTRADVTWNFRLPRLGAIIKAVAGCAYMIFLNAIYLVFDVLCIVFNKISLSTKRT